MLFITIFIVGIIAFLLIANVKSISGQVIYVRSTLDGNQYLVKNLADKQQSADLLAWLAKQMQALVDHLKSHQSDTDYANYKKAITLLVNRFNPRNISENGNNGGNYTTFTLNKGQNVSFCLRTRDANNQLHADKNMLLFVAIHEMAHIASIAEDPNHKTEEFKSNFKFLYDTAIKVGVYQYDDYRANPKRYCNTTINTTP